MGGTNVAKEHAAAAIRNLATNNADNKEELMNLGAGPKLVALLGEGTPGAKEYAAVAIWQLAFNNGDNKVKLKEVGAKGKLQQMIERPQSANAKKHAQGALTNLGE